MRLVDSHAHLNDGRFRQDLPAVLRRAREAGVEAVINVGFDLASSEAAVGLAARYGQVFAAIGVHPHDAKTFDGEVLDGLRRLARMGKVVAVGETGLDYYYYHSSEIEQENAFREQIRLARELRLPIIVHDREAHGRVLSILQEEEAQDVGGVMHCFSGDADFARQCLELGFHISIAGPVTFKQAGTLASVAKMVPLDRLLVETDSPYLAPAPYRGRRNEPAFVRYVVEQIALLRTEQAEIVAAAASANAHRLFCLPYNGS